MPVPSIRPPGWQLSGFDEQDHRPNGPKDYDSHDYRDWKQQIAEHEAEGISRPGAVLECVVPPPRRRRRAATVPRTRASKTAQAVREPRSRVALLSDFFYDAGPGGSGGGGYPPWGRPP